MKKPKKWYLVLIILSCIWTAIVIINVIEEPATKYYLQRNYYYYYAWIIPILPVIMIWLINKFLSDGWRRLFYVYACTHLIFIIFKIIVIWEEGVDFYSDKDNLEYILTHGILPIIGVFFLSLAVRWAVKGFGNDNK